MPPNQKKPTVGGGEGQTLEIFFTTKEGRFVFDVGELELITLILWDSVSFADSSLK